MHSLVVHICHEYFFRVLFVSENVGLYKFYASVMKCNFNLEVATKILQQLISLHVGIQSLSLPCEDKKGPEKINKNGVHDRITVNRRINSDVAVSKYPKKLHNQVFELQITEKRRVIILIEDELKGLVVDDLLYFVDVGLIVDIIQLKT